MLSRDFLLAIAAATLVAAHGRVDVMRGDAGGNTTGFGILGGIVPGSGSNDKTEVDTTVFGSRRALSDGLGSTTSGGANKLSDAYVAMALSGSTLPQVSEGGSISGTIHIVTTDGAGPYTAVIDPTGTGRFSHGTLATVTTQVPGKNGNIAAPKQQRFLPRMLGKIGLMKRATNVNENFPFAATIPAGTKCSGTVAGQSNVCLVKIVNPSGAGPFGGVIAIQMAATNSVPSTPGDSSSATSTCTIVVPAAAQTSSTNGEDKATASTVAYKVDVIDITEEAYNAKPRSAKFRA